MSVTECALCRRAGDSRSMRTCEGCGSYLCFDCARISHNHCPDCTLDGPDSYEF